jgi:hypothetical protein
MTVFGHDEPGRRLDIAARDRDERIRNHVVGSFEVEPQL